MIQTDADAAVVMDEIGAMWEAVDGVQLAPAQAAIDIVARATAVTEFYLAAGKRGTLYSIVVEPQAQWAFYAFAGKTLQHGMDTPEGSAYDAAFRTVMDYHSQYEYLKDQPDVSPETHTNAQPKADAGDTGMGGARYERLLQSVLENLAPGEWDTLFPGRSTWLANGTVFVYGQSQANTRIGILADLTLTPELVTAVGEVNNHLSGGSVWLVEGEAGNWQLIWGAKLPWGFLESDESAVRYITAMAGVAPLMRETLEASFRNRFGGRPWWDFEVSSGAQAIALVAVSC